MNAGVSPISCSVPNLGYPGWTYKFFNGSTVYPFGHGLSYTQFNYNLISSNRSLNIAVNKFQHCHDMNYIYGNYKPKCPAMLIDDLKCDYQLNFEVEVQNVGKMDGSEVVMIYAIPPKGIVGAPIKQVIGFQKVFVRAGAREMVRFVFDACKSLAIVDYTAYRLLASGVHTILVGDGGLSFPFGVRFQV